MAGVYTFLFGTFIYAEAFGKTFYELGGLIGYNHYLFAKHIGWSFTFSVPLIAVSYTHLTLPTIYSV